MIPFVLIRLFCAYFLGTRFFSWFTVTVNEADEFTHFYVDGKINVSNGDMVLICTRIRQLSMMGTNKYDKIHLI